MALTQLSDAVVPEIFLGYMLKETMKRAAIFQSGIVQVDGHIAESLAGAGRTFQHPYWNDLSDNEPDIASDNPAEKSVPDKIGASRAQFVRQIRNKSWSSADLVTELTGSDPQAAIASRVGAWWARYFDRASVQHLNGIMNANVAQNGSDMIYDVTGADGTVTIGGRTYPAYSITDDAILEAKQTMGDADDQLKLLVVHSRIKTNLQKRNLIEYIPSSDARITIPTYMGYQLLGTDNVPVTVSGSDYIYVSYLCGPGVLGFGESPTKKPVATARDEAAGNGMGIETLFTRRQFAFWPKGWNWTDNTCVKEFPSAAEIELAANWSRSWPERKMFPITAVMTKNG